jgi:hypothetical protein
MKYQIRFRFIQGEAIFFNLHDFLVFFSHSQSPPFSYSYKQYEMEAFTTYINCDGAVQLFITEPNDKCPLTMYIDAELCRILLYRLMQGDMEMVEKHRMLFTEIETTFEEIVVSKKDYNYSIFKFDKSYKIRSGAIGIFDNR